MIDKRTNDGDLPEKLSLSRPVETSDNFNLDTPEIAPAVLALQDEVIRLRQEGRPDAKKFPKKGDVSPPESSDSLSGQVQDHSKLLTVLDPPNTFAKPLITQNAEEQLLGLLDVPKGPIAIAQQENLIVSGKPEKTVATAGDQLLGLLDLPQKPIARDLQVDNARPFIAESTTDKIVQPESIKNPKVEVIASLPPRPTSFLDNSIPTSVSGNSSNENKQTRDLASNFGIANENFPQQPPSSLALTASGQPQELPHQQQEKTFVAQHSTQSFDKVNQPESVKAPKAEVIASLPPSPTSFLGNSTPTSTAANSSNENKPTRDLASNFGITSGTFQQQPTTEHQTFVAQTFQNTEVSTKGGQAAQPLPPVADKNSSIDKTVLASLAQPSSERTQTRESSQNSAAPSAERTTIAKEQIASANVGASANPELPVRNQEAGASAIRQGAQGQAPTAERQTIASAASGSAADFSPSFSQSPRDLAKESRDKDLQIANAINYPKFGGTTPAEESSKPVIQQQTPQSFKSSLARDTQPEKAHPLSESFVTGKVLSQPGKDSSTKDSNASANDSKQDTKTPDSKSIDSKISDAKSTDSKSAETKFSTARPADMKSTESKPEGGKSVDSKHVDAKFTEGRAAEPRTIDSTHSQPGSPRPGIEVVGANLPPGERVPTGAQPGKPTDSQVPVKADGSIKSDGPTKSDGTTKSDGHDSSDKSGKKPDGDDKKEIHTGKGPGSSPETGKIPGGKAFNDLLDFIDKADQGDIKPGGKINTPLTGSNTLSPDDVLITGTGAIGQAGFAGVTGEDSKDETSDTDKLSHRRKKYIVQPGDTLDSIAKSELGDARFANLILTINQANIASTIENGKKIAVKLIAGQIIWLPSDHEQQVHAEIYLLDAT